MMQNKMPQQGGMNMPAIMQAMYQAPQTPMSPEQNAYWKLNTQNGQAANEAINRMPFVLDPASMFGRDRQQIKDMMYQPKPAAEGDAAQPAAPQDPQSQMLALLQSNPELLPLIMQQMQPQQQQHITPSNQGP
jgi:hypothetical protein